MKPIRILHLGDFSALCEDQFLDVLLRFLEFHAIDGVVLTGIATIPVPAIFSQAYNKVRGMLDRLKLSPDRCIVTPSPKDLDSNDIDPLKYYSKHFYEPLKGTPYVPGVANSTLFLGSNALQIIGLSSLTHFDPLSQQSSICGSELADCIDAAALISGLEGVDPVRFLAWYHPPTQLTESPLWSVLPYSKVTLVLHGHTNRLPLTKPCLGAPLRTANLITQMTPSRLIVQRYDYRGRWFMSHKMAWAPKTKRVELI